MEPDPITVRVEYQASLREITRKGAERVRARASSPRELYRQLQRQYPLDLAPGHLQVAINQEPSDWDATLRDGDTVTFLPPDSES